MQTLAVLVDHASRRRRVSPALSAYKLMNELIGAGEEDEEGLVWHPPSPFCLCLATLSLVAAVRFEKDVGNLLLQRRHLPIMEVSANNDRVLLCQAIGLDKTLVERCSQVAEVIVPIISRSTRKIGVADRIEAIGLRALGVETIIGVRVAAAHKSVRAY